MTYTDPIEDTIVDAIVTSLDRAYKLNAKDQIAIYQEFREWLDDSKNLHEIIIFNGSMQKNIWDNTFKK